MSVLSGSNQHISAKQYVADGEHGARSLHRNLSSVTRPWLHTTARYTHRRAGHLAGVRRLQRTAFLTLPTCADTLSLAGEQQCLPAGVAARLRLFLPRLGKTTPTIARTYTYKR